MPTSHRLWWLIAVCALAIGLVIEAGAPPDGPSAGTSAAAPAAPAALAAQPRPQRGA